MIGSEHGEWGGKLFWFSADGNQIVELSEENQSLKSSNDNICGIVKIGDETFVFRGMAHLSSDRGKIYKLTVDEADNLKLRSVADLESSPTAFCVAEEQSILIVTNQKVVLLEVSGEVEVLQNTLFATLHPNSTAIDVAGVIYIGMRFFVVRLVPMENGYEQEWLVPQKHQNFTLQGCQCPFCKRQKQNSRTTSNKLNRLLNDSFRLKRAD